MCHSTGVPVVKKLQLQKMKSLRKSAKADRAILAFDLQADLAPAFNWNIKQVLLKYDAFTTNFR
jgi:signal peptidase complex subunit 3